MSNKKNIVEFKGIVVSSEYDFTNKITDVLGSYDIWYPESSEDIKNAIILSQNHKTFIRSGRQVVKQDMVDGSGAIVINLSELNNISLMDGIVQIDAGVTVKELSTFLWQHNLILPLTDNPSKSVVSSILNNDISKLTQSLGVISKYIVDVLAVNSEGKTIRLEVDTDVSYLEQCIDSNAVITNISFVPMDDTEAWMLRFTGTYPDYDNFLNLALSFFSNLDVFEECDLILNAYSGLHGKPTISIEVLGSLEKDKRILNMVAKDIFTNLSLDMVEESYDGSDILQAIIERGKSAGIDPTIDYEKLHSIESIDNLDDFIFQYAQDIHRGIAYDDSGKIYKNFHLLSSLQLNRDNNLEFTGYTYTTKPIVKETTDSILKLFVPSISLRESFRKDRLMPLSHSTFKTRVS